MRRRYEDNCVVIQVSGSMCAEGRREAMFEAAMSFAPCDIYGNDEGRIMYCGHLENDYPFQDVVMMPMTGREDTDPTFHLIGFAMDYKQVIFIDDGDSTVAILNNCKKAAEFLFLGDDRGIVSKLAPIKGVVVRDFGPRWGDQVGRHTEAAEKFGVKIAFFNEHDYEDYPRGFVMVEP